VFHLCWPLVVFRRGDLTYRGGELMLSDPAKHPKRQPGTYLIFKDRLFEVVGYITDGPNRGMTQTINCMSLATVYLTASNVAAAELLRPASPDDEMAELEAAVAKDNE
jgi:hypothetical protein